MRPQDGDLVVARGATPTAPYTVGSHPGGARFSVSKRDEALGVARGLAQRSEVDLWYAEAAAYRLLEVYRRPRQGTSAHWSASPAVPSD